MGGTRTAQLDLALPLAYNCVHCPLAGEDAVVR